MASMEKLVATESLEVLRLVVGPFENNVYLVRDPRASHCVLLDAPFEAARILAAIGTDRVVAILLTHAHMDHVQALPTLREATGAPVGVHPLEPEAPSLRAEISLTDGQKVAVGSRELEVMHTPGHTPGSVCFLLRPILCFCGDTIFAGGPGKTASPEAFSQILGSLERRIYPLPDRMKLLPGHGEGTLVGTSREEYQRFLGRPRTAVPYGDVLWDKS